MKKQSRSAALRSDTKAVPPELILKHGECCCAMINNCVYMRVDGKLHPVARLVWNLHYPHKPLHKLSRVYHKDGDPMNNRHDNLTLIRRRK